VKSKQDALLSHSQAERDAAINFDRYRILQWHRAVFIAIARLLN